MGRVGRAESLRAIAAALDAGITHFDVARLYGYGEAEAVLGEALRGRRDRVVIASKFGLAATRTASALRGLKPLAQSAVAAIPALRPLIRYFTVPARQAPGGAVALPTNPWTLSFSSGTAISAGLDLAHRILVADHLARSRVVLISDLADDPEDVQRLNQVAVADYGPGRTQLRVVALNAAPDDEAFFARIAGTAIADAEPAPAKPSPPPAIPPSAPPIALVAAAFAVLVALAIFELWAARLRFGSVSEAS